MENLLHVDSSLQRLVSWRWKNYDTTTPLLSEHMIEGPQARSVRPLILQSVCVCLCWMPWCLWFPSWSKDDIETQGHFITVGQSPAAVMGGHKGNKSLVCVTVTRAGKLLNVSLQINLGSAKECVQRRSDPALTKVGLIRPGARSSATLSNASALLNSWANRPDDCRRC